MTAPLNLAALKALHAAATKGEWLITGIASVQTGGAQSTMQVFRHTHDMGSAENAAFICAAHTHWLELLAMAGRSERHEEERDHYRTKCFEYQEQFATANAEKAALAERLEIATKALETIDAQVNVIDFHATALAEHAIVRAALAAIAAHEAERGKE